MDKIPKNTIIDIIPLIRLPLSRQQSFSYLNENSVPFGTLVSIPFFRRNVQGIAIGNRDDFFRFGNIKLKKINKILDESLITEKQMELARFISEYYLCPLGIVLKFFVVKKTKYRGLQPTNHGKKSKEFILTKEQRIAVNNILKNKKFLLISGKEKMEIYLELIKKTVGAEKQTILLLPEIPLIYQALDIIKKYFNENLITLFHSQLKGSELYGAYEKIKSGEAKIIIGTRQTIFAPFKNLGMIIIDEEQDVSYKQWDMNPRYNARDVAYKLAEIYEANLLISSIVPSIETYHKLNVPNHKLQIPNKSKIPNLKSQNIEIVDLRKEGWSNNSKKKKNVLISKKLESEIRFALKYNKQVFLFVNRRGMSSFSVCDSCKEVLRCPRCERALIYDKSGRYRCLHCAYKTDIFIKCQKCSGTEFRNIGIGNQTVDREIKKMFPQAKTKLVDFESIKNKNDQKNLFEKIRQKEFNIIIGTQTILKEWITSQFGLIGFINADDFINSSEFNSNEKYFQILLQAIEKSRNGKLIIQTYNTENSIIKSAAENELDVFYQEQLEERKSLKYPPFYGIIKLILRMKNQSLIEKESKNVFEKIKEISKNNKDILVFEPFTPLLSKVRDSYRKQVIIKINNIKSARGKNFKEDETSGNIPEDLIKYLKGLGADWVIDIDPININ